MNKENNAGREQVTESSNSQSVEHSLHTSQTADLSIMPEVNMENQLADVKSELWQCKEKNEALQEQIAKYAATERDPIDNEEVKKVIQQYQCQIAALRLEPNCRMAEEHAQLQKKNRFLMQMNTDLAQKAANDAKEVYACKTRIKKLEELLSSPQMSSPDQENRDTARPVGDNEENAGADCDVNLREQEAGVPSSSVKTAQLRQWSQQLLTLVKQYQQKDRELEHDVRSLNHENAEKDEKIEQLLRQIEVIVQERDHLLEERKTVFSRSLRVEAAVGASPDTEHACSTTPPSDLYLEHYQNLVTQQQSQLKDLEAKLSHRYDHIQDQEEKIQKLMAKIAQNEMDTPKHETDRIGTQHDCRVSGKSNDEFQIKYDELCRQDERKTKSIIELGEKNTKLKEEVRALKVELDHMSEKCCDLKKQLEDSNNTENVAPEVYEVQLKAFQDDWKAEHEEKAKILEDNRNLRLELDRMQLASTFYEPSNPQSPPLGPPSDHNMGSVMGPHPTHPIPSNAGAGFRSSGPEYMRSNTIPPRNAYRSPQTYDRSVSHSPEYYANHPYPAEPRGPPVRNHGTVRVPDGGHGEPSHQYQPPPWPR